jgi:hypothetical protein
LSVPSSWPTPASKTEPTSPSLSAADIDAAPTAPADRPPGLTYQQTLMAMLTGPRPITHATESEQ